MPKQLKTTPELAGRLLHPSRWLGERHRADEQGSAFAFGIRLLASVVLTFALVGIGTFVLLERNLAQRQIDDYGAAQRADVKAFEAVAARASRPTEALEDIGVILDGVAKRPGTREAVLIDQHHAIVQALKDAQVGTTDSDRGIDAALEHGRSFAGRDSAPTADHRDFQFVAPVNLPSGRYAYEVTYDHRTYDAQVNDVRTILGLIGLGALIGGGGVFYLVGG